MVCVLYLPLKVERLIPPHWYLKLLLVESSLFPVKLSALSEDDHRQSLPAVSSLQEQVKTTARAVTLGVSSGEGNKLHPPSYSEKEFVLFLSFWNSMSGAALCQADQGRAVKASLPGFRWLLQTPLPAVMNIIFPGRVQVHGSDADT